MALRFVRTIDQAPYMYSRGAADEAADDFLLCCGAWTVGRIQRPGDSRRDILVWSLTGPIAPQAPVVMRGQVGALDAGKAALVASFRAWAAWAGIAPQGAARPRWAATGRADEWLLMSGALDVGRVHRPDSGPRRDPHWELRILTAATPAPFAQAGWADDVAAAQVRLSAAWSEFLAWAQLPPVASG